MEFSETSFEGIDVEDFGADATFLNRPLSALFGESIPGGAFEERDDAGDFGEHTFRGVVGLGEAHPLHDFAENLSVGFGAGEWGDDGIDALHSAFAIGRTTSAYSAVGVMNNS